MEDRTEILAQVPTQEVDKKPSVAARVKPWRKDIALSLKYGLRAAFATTTVISALSNGYDLDSNTKLLPTTPAYAHPDTESAPLIKVLTPEDLTSTTESNNPLGNLAESIAARRE
jgi:hypothetical protein